MYEEIDTFNRRDVKNNVDLFNMLKYYKITEW